MSTKAEHATKLHENGCNCAQAVACSFSVSYTHLTLPTTSRV